MSQSNPGQPEFLNVFGLELQVIAQITDEYYLVAHKNGPAIATSRKLCILESPSESEDAEDDSGIPEHVRKDAVRKYREFSWPLVRSSFGF